MRKSLRALVVASALAAGVAVAPALQAHEVQSPQGPPMGHGSMMGHGSTMGHGGMMNMMGHMSQMRQMSQMSQMAETCNKMMQGAMGKPDQAPEAPPQHQ